VAVSDSSFAVAYLEPQRSPLALSLATFSAKGVAAGIVDAFNTQSTVVEDSNPVLAGLPCGKYVAAWTDYGGDGDELGVAIRWIDPNAKPSGPPSFANTTTSFSQFDPDIVATGSQVVVGWVDDSNPDTAPDLRMRKYDLTGKPLSPELTLAATMDKEADLALATFAGSWAAAWRDGTSGQETIRVHTETHDWTVGPPFLPGPAGSKPALVGLDATHWLVAYAVGTDPDGSGVANGSKIQVAVLDPGGPPHVSDVPAIAPAGTGLAQSQPNLVNVNGAVFLGWRTQAAPNDPNGEELWRKALGGTAAALDFSAQEVPLPRWPQHQLGDQRRPAFAASTLPPEGALVSAWDDLGRSFDGGEGNVDVVVQLVPVPPIVLPPATLSIKPSPGDFGSVTAGTSSLDIKFTVTNTGGIPTGALNVALSGANAGSFVVDNDACTNVPLPASGLCTIAVHFAPPVGSIGAQQATLTVSAQQATPTVTGAAASKSTTLTGTALAPAALTLAPLLGTFGSVTAGTFTADITFTVKNTGGTTSGALTVALAGTNAGSFVIDSDVCTNVQLPANDTCTIAVRFAPPLGAVDQQQAMLTVTGKPGESTLPATLTGKALAPADLTIAPLQYDFGSQTAGTSSADQPFTLTNNGGSPTGSLVLAPGGTNSGSFVIDDTNHCGAGLAASAACTFSIRFAPPSGALGFQQATVTVSGGSTSTSTMLQGTALAPAQLSISPLSIDFGSVVTGQTNSKTITVTNNGGSPSSAISTNLVGGNPAFVFGANGCTGGLVAGGMCTITVVFAPATGTPGQDSATLTVSATQGGMPPPVSLSGTEATPAVLEVTGETAFGTVFDDQGPVSHTLTVRNLGGSPSGPLSSTFVTTPQFSADKGCDGVNLTPGATCSIVVTYAPFCCLKEDDSTTLTVSDSPDGGPSSTVQVTVKGSSVVAFVNLESDPTSYDFGTVNVNVTANPAIFTIFNSGTIPSGPLTVQLISPNPPLATQDFTMTTTITNNATAPPNNAVAGTVTVTFRPRGGVMGPESIIVSVSDPQNSVGIVITGAVPRIQ
jgi:hypothetical protein